MGDRGKTKQARSKGSNRRLKEDRIGQLPDPLICQILSYLPTKEAVKTSVLSARWRSLWLWVTRLELNSGKFPNLRSFVSFANRFLHSDRVSCIHKLELTDDEYIVASYLKSCIDAAVKRKIQHLDVVCSFPSSNSYRDLMPLSLYMCETLVSLKLQLVSLGIGIGNAESVSLPCLKTMHLKTVWFPNEVTFERLVSSSPALEQLEIEGFDRFKARFLRVVSRSLKRLAISISYSLRDCDSGIVIDAPRLRFLSIGENLPESFIITNMDSNVELDIYLRCGMVFDKSIVVSKIKKLRGFLSQISTVRDMIIHLDTFKLIYEYMKLESLPQFGYMSRLQVALYYSHSKWLPTFLESFPNLKSLILVCYDDSEEKCSKEMNQFSFSHVPECLLSSLEFVDFKVLISGHDAETKLVRYFLENSAILKKLTLPLDYYSVQIQDNFVKKLLKIPRRSTECKVVFL